MKWFLVLVIGVLSACATLSSRTVYETPVEATMATYDTEVGEDYDAILVVFGAEWCPGCQVVEATFPQLIDAHKGKLKIVKVDVDKLSGQQVKELEPNFNGYIPFIIMLDDGKRTYEGNLQSEDQFYRMVEGAIN